MTILRCPSQQCSRMLWSSKTALTNVLTTRSRNSGLRSFWTASRNKLWAGRAGVFIWRKVARLRGWLYHHKYANDLPCSGRKCTKSWLAQGSSNFVLWSRCPIWIKITDWRNTASNLKQSKKLGITNPGLQLQEARKQPTSGDVTTGFPAKWRLRNERRNSILLTWHNPDLGSACDWSCRKGKFTPTKQTLHPDLGSDTSSVWNLRAFFSKMTFSGAGSLKIFHWPDHVDLELKDWGAVSH